MPSSTSIDVRARAEEHLRALVGRDDVVLYDDQWAAISALAVDKRRSLVVQRTGWGKSAVYFVATLLLRDRAPADGHRLADARADAQPDPAAERAGISAITIISTNMEQWDPVPPKSPKISPPTGRRGSRRRRCRTPRTRGRAVDR